jgi:protein gp37
MGMAGVFPPIKHFMNMTSIEWTDATWNPSSGCDKVSPGCKNCYAEAIAERFRGSKGFPNGFDFTLHPERFGQPYKLKEPARIFVDSMSDLFHEDMQLKDLRALFRVMADCHQHQFQILTKRAERVAALAPLLNWTSNIWIGVSVENQRYAQRLDYLREVRKAAVRFVSAEPLLGPVTLNLKGINWVIVGGESGPRHRPFDSDWARGLRDQCAAAGAAFFMKQLGGHPRHRSELSDLPKDLRIREFPK